jgi:hypothetical protein
MSLNNIARIINLWRNSHTLAPEELEKKLEEAYRKHAPQHEIDALETELSQYVSEGGHDESDEDLGPAGVSEGISIDEALKDLYHQYLHPTTYDHQELLRMMRSVIDGSDWTYTRERALESVTDAQILDAAKDVYEHHLSLKEKRKGPRVHKTPEEALQGLQKIKERLKKSVSDILKKLAGDLKDIDTFIQERVKDFSRVMYHGEGGEGSGSDLGEGIYWADTEDYAEVFGNVTKAQIFLSKVLYADDSELGYLSKVLTGTKSWQENEGLFKKLKAFNINGIRHFPEDSSENELVDWTLFTKKWLKSASSTGAR